MTFIKTHKELPMSVLSRIEENPFAREHRTLSQAVTSYKNDVDYYNNEVKTYRQKIENLKANALYSATKKRQSERNLKIITEAMEAHTSSNDLSFLDNISELVNNTGNKFVALNFLDADTSSPKIILKYIRPPRLIEKIPQQPYLVQITYISKDGTISFYSAKCLHAFAESASAYVHPHLSSDGAVCLGNYLDILAQNNITATLQSAQDHIVLLDQLLSTYNPDSPYRDIFTLTRDLSKGFFFKNNNSDMSTYIDYGRTIVDESIKARIDDGEFDTDNTTIPITQIIGVDLYNQWVQMLENSNIPLKDMALDRVVELRNYASNPEDSNSNYEFAQSQYDALRRDFPEVKFVYYGDYVVSSYNEEDDVTDYDLYEEEYETLFENWAETLEVAISMGKVEGNLQIKLPEISLAFN